MNINLLKIIKKYGVSYINIYSKLTLNNYKIKLTLNIDMKLTLNSYKAK